MNLKKLSIKMLIVLTALSFRLTPVCSAAGDSTAAPQVNQQQATQTATVPAGPGSPQTASLPQASPQVPGSSTVGIADNALSQVIQEAGSRAGETTPNGAANPGTEGKKNEQENGMKKGTEESKKARIAELETERRLLAEDRAKQAALIPDAEDKVAKTADVLVWMENYLKLVEAEFVKPDPYSQQEHEKRVNVWRAEVEKAKAAFNAASMALNDITMNIAKLNAKIRRIDADLEGLKKA